MAWELNGNSDATATSFLGPTSSQPLVVKTTPSTAGATPLERLRVTPEGWVGIGIQKPQAKLTVAGGGALINNVAIGTDGLSVDYPNEQETIGLASPGTSAVLRLQSPNGLAFHTGAPGTAAADNLRMTIAPSGEVGLGKAPGSGYKLEVVGTVNATDYHKNGVPLVGSQWTDVAGGGIGYVGGNVGIGTASPRAKLDIGDSGDLLFTAAAEDPGDIVFQTSAGVQKGRVWSNPDPDAGLFLSSGDNTPRIAIDANGKTRSSSGLRFPKTSDGDAELSNYDTLFPSAGTARLRMADQPPDTPTPTYAFQVGHSFTLRIGETELPGFVSQFGINQNGDATFAGSKGGYVVDHFINSVGDALEQGDVVVIGSADASRYSGTDNNIPLIEADLTDRAYDARVCGIVASVVTENDLPYAEVQAPDVEEVARDANATEGAVQRALELGVDPFALEGTGSGGRVVVADIESAAEQSETSGTNAVPPRLATYLNPLVQFAGEITRDSDATKIEDQQMGRMVTLGAFAHCKVDAGIAPISAGDLLTTSPTRGHAQKVLEQEKGAGTIVGKALASLDGGRGKIPVLVMLQ